MSKGYLVRSDEGETEERGERKCNTCGSALGRWCCRRSVSGWMACDKSDGRWVRVSMKSCASHSGSWCAGCNGGITWCKTREMSGHL